MFWLFLREDKGDQILDNKQEIQTMEEQLKKLQKEVQTPDPAAPDLYCQIWAVSVITIFNKLWTNT